MASLRTTLYGEAILFGGPGLMEALGVSLPWQAWAGVTAVGVVGFVASIWHERRQKKSELGPEIRISDTTTYREQPDRSRVVTTTTLVKPVDLKASMRAEGGGEVRLKPLPKDDATATRPAPSRKPPGEPL